MKKNSISEFELERQDFKIKLKRGTAVIPVAQEDSAPATLGLPAPANASGSPVSAPGSSSGLAPGELEIKSPMIGTFYRAPSPEAANYVEIGAEVNPDTVVCIIEAMKV